MAVVDELDEAFERLAAAGFELPNGFVNHGPMACEALAVLDIGADIGAWAERFASVKGLDAVPVDPTRFDPLGNLGDYRLLPEWIGYFDAVIRTDGWSAVVRSWVPKLMPAFDVALFHGTIRTAHAVRAISEVDTAARRVELARALGYWAARYREGASGPIVELPSVGDAVLDAAAVAVRRYLDGPDIFTLHGVTGAMAVDLLVPHINESAGWAAVTQIHADHAAFYGLPPRRDSVHAAPVDWSDLARAAAGSGDPHQVKLVEACRRGGEATSDGAFAAAGALVTEAGVRRRPRRSPIRRPRADREPDEAAEATAEER